MTDKVVSKTVAFVLQDGEHGRLPVAGEIHATDMGVEIRLEGYGDAATKDGAGVPIYIELYAGQVRVHVWSDINREDPTHTVHLDKARLSQRR